MCFCPLTSMGRDAPINGTGNWAKLSSAIFHETTSNNLCGGCSIGALMLDSRALLTHWLLQTWYIAGEIGMVTYTADFSLQEAWLQDTQFLGASKRALRYFVKNLRHWDLRRHGNVERFGAEEVCSTSKGTSKIGSSV